MIDISSLRQSSVHKNTEEFQTEAAHFREFGCYTKHPRSESSTSSYQKYWIEQARRCIYGYNAGHSAVTGYHYFLLNFAPIIKVQTTSQVNKSTGLMTGSRASGFVDFWDGQWEYFNYLDEAEKSGLHCAVMKSRGKGFSWLGASMLNRNYFLIPESKSFAIAYDEGYLLKDGLLSKTWMQMDWIDQHTEWAKRRSIKDTTLEKTSSYREKERGVWTEKGFKSQIIGLTVGRDVDNVRGIRGKLVLWEEAGKNPKLLQAWEIALKSMQEGKVVFGTMCAFGTGGTYGLDIMSLEELFYSGGYNERTQKNDLSGYSVHLVENKWDPLDKPYCGFFYPEYLNRGGEYKDEGPFMDKDGNSNIPLALKDIYEGRQEKERSTTNPNAVARHIAEQPVTPGEAFIRVSNTLFPVNDIKHRLAEVESDPKKYYDSFDIGRFVIHSETGQPVWVNDVELKPLWSFPVNNKEDNEGCVIIYEPPVKNDQGLVPWGQYLAGTDPYNQDLATQNYSLGSTLIMNKLTERIVAEYTGRPKTDIDYYETVRRLLLYYNAICNYENDVRGMFKHFENKNSLYLLCDTPKCIVDKIHDKQVLHRMKGTPATTPINEWGRQLIKRWLVTPVSKDSEVTNLHKICSVPLLKELIYWTPEGNYDRVSALGMLMILKEEFFRITVDVRNEIKTTAGDPFWDRALGITEKTIHRPMWMDLKNRNT